MLLLMGLIDSAPSLQHGKGVRAHGEGDGASICLRGYVVIMGIIYRVDADPADLTAVDGVLFLGTVRTRV